MIVFGFVILSIISAVLLFLQMPAFGRIPFGKRLQGIKTSSHYGANGFENLERTVMMAEGVSYPEMLKAFFRKGIDREPQGVLPSVKTNLHAVDDACLVWFGHSSYFFRMANKNILVDPVFSDRASPVQFAGMRAYAGANIYKSTDMPALDAIIITHDHYDHLDYQTIKALHHRTKAFYTSLGVGTHLERWGVPPAKIVEMDWWQTKQIFDDVEIIATPARHFSGRGLVRNRTLWSSFVVRGRNLNIFIGGDSGYDKTFKKIGDCYGPFDLVVLESGQYDLKWPQIHMAPEEAVQACVDLGGDVLLPVHWGKFTLALHPWKEPVVRVLAEAKRRNVKVATPIIGAPIQIRKPQATNAWWDF
jgi:L-ascorbate metabolism protein UlaG (beta-lactamase superfamily)